MLDGKFEARARAEREAQHEAALAAAASRAALVAEAMAQAGHADPNFPVVDSAATPRSEQSDGDPEGGTPRRSGSIGRRPSSGSAGGTPGSRRGPSSPSAALTPGAAAGRRRKKGDRGSNSIDETEEQEGEVEGDAAESGGKRKSAASLMNSIMSQSFMTRRRSSATQVVDAKQQAIAAADLFTEEERRDAALWVQQAKKLEETLEPYLKKLDKLKAVAKKEKVQAGKEIKALEKLVTAPPKKDGKAPGLSKREALEKMALEELKVDDCDIRIESAEARAKHYASVLAQVPKLREWLEPQLMLVAESMPNPQLVRSRVHELSSIVSAEWKEMGSPSSQGLVVKIHETSPLEPDVHLVHPAILVSVIDEEREPTALGGDKSKHGLPPGNFLLKQDEFGIAVQQNEGLSRLVPDDERAAGGSNAKETGARLVYKADPRGCPHVLPVLTRPCPLLSLAMESAAAERSRDGKGAVKSIQAGVAPRWEEEIAFAQEPAHMLQDKVVYFFELVDFQASSPSDDIAQDDTSARVGGAAALLNPWKRIAWGFYRPNAPNANLDGSAAGSALARSRASSVSSVLSRGFSWRATRVAPSDRCGAPSQFGSGVRAYDRGPLHRGARRGVSVGRVPHATLGGVCHTSDHTRGNIRGSRNINLI